MVRPHGEAVPEPKGEAECVGSSVVTLMEAGSVSTFCSQSVCFLPLTETPKLLDIHEVSMVFSELSVKFKVWRSKQLSKIK
jgi:hypothetical protein